MILLFQMITFYNPCKGIRVVVRYLTLLLIIFGSTLFIKIPIMEESGIMSVIYLELLD